MQLLATPMNFCDFLKSEHQCFSQLKLTTEWVMFTIKEKFGFWHIKPENEDIYNQSWSLLLTSSLAECIGTQKTQTLIF